MSNDNSCYRGNPFALSHYKSVSETEGNPVASIMYITWICFNTSWSEFYVQQYDHTQTINDCYIVALKAVALIFNLANYRVIYLYNHDNEMML